MNRTFDANCSDLRVDAIFIVETAILFVTSVFGVVLNGIVLTLLPKFELFSGNVQILLHSLAIAALTACSAIVVRSFYNAAIIVFGFAAFSVNNTVCALLDGTYVASRSALMLSVAAIGGERLYVTIRGNYADDGGNKQWAAVLASLSAWMIGTLNVILLIWNAAVREFQICYCYFSFTMSFPALAWAAGSYAVLEISVIAVYWYVYYASRTRLMDFTINTARHCLHERYQMWNNIRTTVMLFPWILVHGIFYFVTLICMIFLVKSYRRKPSIYNVNCLLLILTVWTVDLILAPILWIRNNERFKCVTVWRYPIMRYVVGLTQTEKLNGSGRIVAPATKRVDWSRDCALDADQSTTSRLLTPVRPTAPYYNTTVVEHRIEPEKSSEILEQIWATKKPVEAKKKVSQNSR